MSNDIELEDNSLSYNQINEKRLTQDYNESDQAEDGEIDLEEGEIEDDDLGDNDTKNNDNKRKHNNNHKKKHKHKKRKKHNQSREKKLKTAESTDNESIDNEIEEEEDDKEEINNEEDIRGGGGEEKKQQNKKKSLLSIPLLNDINLLKTNNKDDNQEEINDDSDDEDDDDDDDDDDEDDQIDDENTNDSLSFNQPIAKSLSELFGTGTNQVYIDPTITEKENSKPVAQKPTIFDIKEKKILNKLNKKQRQELKRERKRLGILSKKQQKKIEYKRKQAEILKEKQKREQEKKEKIKETLCKFYLEGRCTKGDECPFSHNTPINKKLEVCKYYLNGYCAKNTNCTYMHSEFPCKFYHINNKECKSGASCRFSHSPMTPEMREAFEKYLKENDETIGASKKSSLLGSPPRHLKEQQDKKLPTISNTRAGLLPLPNIPPLKSLTPQPIPSLLSKPLTVPQSQLSIPSLMDIKPLLGSKTAQQNQPPSIMSNLNDIKPQLKPQQTSFFCQDIDERCPSAAQVPTQVTTQSLLPTTDIDERAPPVINQSHQQPLPPTGLLTNLLETGLDANTIIAKLLEQKQQQQQNLKLPNIVNDLLTSLTSVTATPNLLLQPSIMKQPVDSFYNNLYQQIKQENNEPKTSELTIDDSEPIEIDARTDGTLPYNIVEIDINPSSLWKYPPTASSNSKFVDPRIEFYSDKLNNKNFKDKILPEKNMYQNQLIPTPSPMSSNTNISSASSPPQQQQQQQNLTSDIKPKDYRDPRLLSKNSQPSSTNSESTLPFLNDLIQNQMNKSSNSLLSSLPDLKLPTKPLNEQPIFNQQSTQQISKGTVDSNSVVKLSIEDYKRKLQKPTNGINGDSSLKTLSNKITSSYAPQQQLKQDSTPLLPYLPQIPSYSVNTITTNSLNDITPPQSLHELLKNFPNS